MTAYAGAASTTIRRARFRVDMKTAAEAIFVGKARQYNRRFLQMCSHHLVEPVACTPASGWEKGQVENQVGNLRDQLFRPKPKVASLVELNSWLEAQCIAYAKRHNHPEFKDRTVWEVFQQERRAWWSCADHSTVSWRRRSGPARRALSWTTTTATASTRGQPNHALPQARTCQSRADRSRGQAAREAACTGKKPRTAESVGKGRADADPP